MVVTVKFYRSIFICVSRTGFTLQKAHYFFFTVLCSSTYNPLSKTLISYFFKALSLNPACSDWSRTQEKWKCHGLKSKLLLLREFSDHYCVMIVWGNRSVWPAKHLIYAANPFGSLFFSLDSHSVLQRFLGKRHGHVLLIWTQF